jgi:hypothetical protein
MQADLEAELMRRVHDGEHARDVIGDLLTRGAIASPKQGWRTLEKWCDKGWYDFGVSLDLGWMTEKAPCGRSKPRELPACLAPAPSGHASPKIPQQPARSPAEWREIIEQRLKEIGGDVAVGSLDAAKVQIVRVEEA